MTSLPRRGTTQGVPLPQGDEKWHAVQNMFDTIAPRYDLVNRVMTFRLDVGWRRRALSQLAARPGDRILDLAAGTGDLTRELRRLHVAAVALDFSFNMLRAGSDHPRVQADGAALPFPDSSLDGAISGFALRNFVDLDAVLRELARAVRPGGRIVLLDVAEPTNPVLRAGHAVYFRRVVPLIGGMLSDPAAYSYLPKSTAYLPPPDELRERVAAVGFPDATTTMLSGGITQLIAGTRRRT